MKKIGTIGGNRQFLSLGDVAEMLSVSTRRVHQLRAEDWFPQAIQLGPRQLRWNRDELVAAVTQRAQRITSQQEPAALRDSRAKGE